MRTGQVHLFDWDEINFAESAREMMISDDYLTVQINFKPFWEKPPLFFWLQAGSMHLFGINEFAARFPNAVFGFLTLLTVFFVGRRYGGHSFGMLWMLVYIGSFLPHIYFKTCIIDPVFNYFIFLSLVAYIEAINRAEHRMVFAAIAGLFAGLSFLTKGPVGALLVGLSIVVYSVYRSGKGLPSWKLVLMGVVGFLFPAMIWISAELQTHGFVFLEKFLRYQIELFTSPVATQGQPFYYHFLIVLVGCFPMSIVALAAFNKRFVDENHFSLWMKILFWVVLILFSISKTKIVHYSSMTWLPLSYLAAKVMFEGKAFPYTVQRLLYGIIGMAIGIAVLGSTLFFYYPELWTPYVKDVVFLASFAQAIPPPVWLPLTGIVFFISFFLAAKRSKEQNPMASALSWAVGHTLLIAILYAALLPRIEKLSQGSLISLISQVKHENALIYTYGFKSYAHFFYGERTLQNASNEYLPAGQKPANESERIIYLLAREPNHELDSVAGHRLIRCEGGYRLYRKEAFTP